MRSWRIGPIVTACERKWPTESVPATLIGSVSRDLSPFFHPTDEQTPRFDWADPKSTGLQTHDTLQMSFNARRPSGTWRCRPPAAHICYMPVTKNALGLLQ